LFAQRCGDTAPAIAANDDLRPGKPVSNLKSRYQKKVNRL